MASAWGNSWGVSWGNSWGAGVTPPTPGPQWIAAGHVYPPKKKKPKKQWDTPEPEQLRLPAVRHTLAAGTIRVRVTVSPAALFVRRTIRASASASIRHVLEADAIRVPVSGTQHPDDILAADDADVFRLLQVMREAAN